MLPLVPVGLQWREMTKIFHPCLVSNWYLIFNNDKINVEGPGWLYTSYVAWFWLDVFIPLKITSLVTSSSGPINVHQMCINVHQYSIRTLCPIIHHFTITLNLICRFVVPWLMGMTDNPILPKFPPLQMQLCLCALHLCVCGIWKSLLWQVHYCSLTPEKASTAAMGLLRSSLAVLPA